MLLEVCIDSAAGLAAALAGGAGRLEVCSRLDLGGLTPTPELLERSLAAARQYGTRLGCDASPVADGGPRGVATEPGTAMRLHAMVRARANRRFAPDAAEFSELCADLLRVKNQGADGAVFGLLTADGRVDRERTRELVHRARPLSVTFHRAFDLVRDPEAELEVLIGLGIERVLTSGGAATAAEGIEVLAALVRRAAGRIVVMPGGGVREPNAPELARRTGATELHASVPFHLPSPS